MFSKCYFCEKESRESYGGYWCENCRKIKNLGNVYGFERVLKIMTKCCIRNEDQLENKIHNHNNKTGDDSKDYDKPYNLRLSKNDKKNNKS